jgi:hypothetical protein
MPPTQPYHLYFRRHEPTVIFGSRDSGVSNPTGPGGESFLDAVWTAAPFDDHSGFVSTVERIAAEWEGRGALSEYEATAITETARSAEEDLRV